MPQIQGAWFQRYKNGTSYMREHWMKYSNQSLHGDQTFTGRPHPCSGQKFLMKRMLMLDLFAVASHLVMFA